MCETVVSEPLIYIKKISNHVHQWLVFRSLDGAAHCGGPFIFELVHYYLRRESDLSKLQVINMVSIFQTKPKWNLLEACPHWEYGRRIDDIGGKWLDGVTLLLDDWLLYCNEERKWDETDNCVDIFSHKEEQLQS